MEEVIHFFNYGATNPGAIIIFHHSDTILTLISDTAYLDAQKARSRDWGYPINCNCDEKLYNGLIYVLVKIKKNSNACCIRNRM